MGGRWVLGLLVLSLLIVATIGQKFPQCALEGLEVTKTQIDGSMRWMFWGGLNNKVVFLQSSQYTLYRSEDEGKTWEDQTALFGAGSRVQYLAASADPQKLYFWTNKYEVYITTNAGKSYEIQPVLTSFQFTRIAPHPTEANYAFATAWSSGCAAGSTAGCHYDLYFTNDFGTTWKVVDTYVITIVWGSQRTFEGTSTLNILYTTLPDKTGNQRSKSRDGSVLVRKNLLNLNEHSDVMFARANAAFKTPVNDSIIFVAEKMLTGGYSLLASEDDGDNFVTGHFPIDLEENSYTIEDETDGAVLVNIQHSAGQPHGNLYVSDAYASQYSLSLRNVKRGSSNFPFYGGTDFVKMAGLDGIYVANVFDEDQVISVDDPLKTMITYDMGGNWQRIPAPKTDSNGQPIVCEGFCSLNFFGLYERWWGRFYSVPGSTGLMLATGNTGTQLKSTDINTYFTRDGGMTWEEIRKGAHTLEVADHGGLLVLANIETATSNLLFSWNEGLNFTECQFSQTGDVQISNIVVEPTFTSQQFILYGTQEGSADLVLYHLDFQGLHERTCLLPDQPGSPGSDYELWSPTDVVTDELSKQCLLGSHLTYSRRKRNVRCFNPQEFESVKSSTPCECTREDYICDYCYEVDTNGDCALACTPDEMPPSPPVPCDVDYFQTQGYRLIPGDRCQGGLDLKPVKKPCSGGTVTEPVATTGGTDNPTHGGSGSALAVVAILIVIICVLVFASLAALVLVMKTQKPEGLYERVKDIKFLQSFKPKNKAVYSRLNGDFPEDDLE